MVKRPDLSLRNRERAKSRRVVIKCAYCGKSKTIPLCQRRKSNYCNMDCRKKGFWGKGNPMYGKKQSDKCKLIVSKNSKKLIGKNNPMFNKKIARNGMSYYFKDLGHRCRSSWEVNIARILKYRNIKYEYESVTFDLKKGDSYTPDFYLIDKNKFLEIKGYVTDKFKDKFSRFLKQYPYIEIEIIEQVQYDQLIKEYKCKIEFECSGRVKRNFDFVEETIKSIKVTNYSPKKVYNLSVEEDESFICNGLVVHNTKPHWTSADNLKGWSRRVLGNENLAYAVQKKIAMKGVESHPFFRPALSQVRNYWVQYYWKQVMSTN